MCFNDLDIECFCVNNLKALNSLSISSNLLVYENYIIEVLNVI